MSGTSSDPTEGDLAFLGAAENDFIAMSDRLMLMACTVCILLGDQLVGKLCPDPSAGPAVGTLVGSELHQASLFALASMSFASAACRSAAVPFLWLLSFLTLLPSWERGLIAAQDEGKVSHSSFIMAHLITGLLFIWALWISSRCSGLCSCGKASAREIVVSPEAKAT
eukprot:TRINITY_DN25689_c0_g1_i2.p1 TRINITY_DN25689_c0_g1~~TRINITY_DN25689_c0_g1_i2.p1  ORF type:complete len:168 (+),score=16.33 TRINITY_DN25689_c0_g1_i2:53-556(+)